MNEKNKCPHEDDIFYGELKQVDGEPLYEVTCMTCKATGVIHLVEGEEEWNVKNMNLNEVKQTKTQEEARVYAVNWQHWVSEQSLSYGELAEWQAVFEELGKKFALEQEFKENGII